MGLANALIWYPYKECIIIIKPQFRFNPDYDLFLFLSIYLISTTKDVLTIKILISLQILLRALTIKILAVSLYFILLYILIEFRSLRDLIIFSLFFFVKEPMNLHFFYLLINAHTVKLSHSNLPMRSLYWIWCKTM